ncbi:MAG: GNAT family N-acetyltransferase [Candidatus Hodarchaeota archaeon]
MSQSTVEFQEIRALEQVAFESWPASEVVPLGGWLMRADAGVTRRANSVFPQNDPDLPLEDAINQVIEFYNHRNLIPRFQITEASSPFGLDDVLADAGFLYEMKTYLQTAEIEGSSEASVEHEVELISTPTDEWFSAYARISSHPPLVLRVRRGIFNRMPDGKRFALVREGESIIGISVGVVYQNGIGIFGVRTDDTHKRRGVATSINNALLAWARLQGIKNAYLQVEADNEPALRLYHTLGFTTKYAYWYRQLLD